MTVTEAHKTWSIPKSRIYSYCKEQKIPCKKVKGEWSIRDGLLKPYFTRKKVTQSQIKIHILNAVDSEEFINYRLINVGKTNFSKKLKELIDDGFVQINNSSKYYEVNDCYLLKNGECYIIEAENKKDSEKLKLIETIAAGISRGITEGINN